MVSERTKKVAPIQNMNVLSTDPPTYEEAIEGDQTSGKPYHPKYPVYRRQTSYSSGSNQ